MKKKIYILPDFPSENGLAKELNLLKPPLSPAVLKQLITSSQLIQQRLRDATLSQSPHHIHQKQTISDGRHTVTLVGRLDPPSAWQKLLDLFGG